MNDRSGKRTGIVQARAQYDLVAVTAPPTEPLVRRVYVGAHVSSAALQDPDFAPVVTHPESACATTFRLLARRIEHQADVRSVGVTSPERREGKSFCAFNLALALAERGEGLVLLLEANLYSPTLAHRIGFAPPHCFGEKIGSAMEQPDQSFRCVEVCFPNLHVVAVDPQKSDPRPLNAAGFSAAMRQLLLSPYTHVVVDCPPVFGSADASVVEDSVDGMLLCAATGVTKRSQLREARRQLEPARILATALIPAAP